MALIKSASEIFRDYETDGVPASGWHEPDIADVRAWASYVENAGFENAGNNLLLNHDGMINQAAPATNADDTYGHDRWTALTQSNAVAASTVADVENGTPFMLRLTQSNAAPQRMGYLQILSADYSKRLRGQYVSASGRVRASASGTLRYAICEWTGTADVVTSDIVNAWANATLTAGQFFLGASLNVLATGSLALTANTLANLAALTAQVGASCNNLMFFYWTDLTVAQNVTVDGAFMLNVGQAALPRAKRWPWLELALCQRFLQVFGGESAVIYAAGGQNITTTTARVLLALLSEMFAAPTVTVTAAEWQVTQASGTQQACTALAAGAIGRRLVQLNVTVAANLVAGNATLLSNVSAANKIICRAEL